MIPPNLIQGGSRTNWKRKEITAGRIRTTIPEHISS
jgi:hypothetical protein